MRALVVISLLVAAASARASDVRWGRTMADQFSAEVKYVQPLGGGRSVFAGTRMMPTQDVVVGFVAADGGIEETHVFGGSGTEDVLGMAVSPDGGTIAVVGYTSASGSLQFCTPDGGTDWPGANADSSSANAFLWVLRKGQDCVRREAVGAQGVEEKFSSVAFDSNGDLLIGGWTKSGSVGTVDMSQGGYDALLARTTGGDLFNRAWISVTGTVADDKIYAVGFTGDNTRPYLGVGLSEPSGSGPSSLIFDYLHADGTLNVINGGSDPGSWSPPIMVSTPTNLFIAASTDSNTAFGGPPDGGGTWTTAGSDIYVAAVDIPLNGKSTVFQVSVPGYEDLTGFAEIPDAGLLFGAHLIGTQVPSTGHTTGAMTNGTPSAFFFRTTYGGSVVERAPVGTSQTTYVAVAADSSHLFLAPNWLGGIAPPMFSAIDGGQTSGLYQLKMDSTPPTATFDPNGTSQLAAGGIGPNCTLEADVFIHEPEGDLGAASFSFRSATVVQAPRTVTFGGGSESGPLHLVFDGGLAAGDVLWIEGEATNQDGISGPLQSQPFLIQAGLGCLDAGIISDGGGGVDAGNQDAGSVTDGGPVVTDAGEGVSDGGGENGKRSPLGYGCGCNSVSGDLALLFLALALWLSAGSARSRRPS